MYARLGWLLGLITLGVAGDAAAQRAEIVAGGGVTLSGPDISHVNGHGMAAGLIRLTHEFAARLDIVYVAGEGDLIGLNGGGLLWFGRPEAWVRPYLLVGAGAASSEGVKKAAINGGLGIRLASPEGVGVFVEARLFKFFQVTYGTMLFTSAGLRIPIP